MKHETSINQTPNAASPASVGANIRALRQRAHLSQGELAQRLGIRQGPLCNLEKGRHYPSAQMLLKLAETLDVTTDTILRPGYHIQHIMAEPSTAYYVRSEESTPYGVMPDMAFGSDHGTDQWLATSLPAYQPGEALARKIEAAAYETLALEDICQTPRHARIHLNMPFAKTLPGMSLLALQMRSALGVSNTVVFDYLELFENHGLRVIFMPLQNKAHSLSYHDLRHNNVFIFIANKLNPERQIFALLFELGLLLLTASHCPRPCICDFKDNEYNKLARFFAANFLMPEMLLRQTIQQIGVKPDEWDFDLLLRIKHRFGVSAESFNYRLLELELITPALQNTFRTQIKAHYAKHRFAEPGTSRRILSPNGRLGDLLHLALARQHPEAQRISTRLTTLKLNLD